MAIKPPWFDPHMLVEATLQGYHLESFLGAGGFGAVYLTADAREEDRAAKVLYPPHSLGNEDLGVWRFRSTNFGREALAAARFHHPNIIRVFDTFQVNWCYQDPLKTQQGHLDLSGEYPLHVYVAEYIPDGVDRRLRDGGCCISMASTSICRSFSSFTTSSTPSAYQTNPAGFTLALV